MGVELSGDDISRSHPIGKPNNRGNIQIISKFKNWKVKNNVYSKKCKLKNTSVFVSEDLTKFSRPGPGAIHGKTRRLCEFL